MAERCGETLHVHIEKALYGYEGVYPATVQEFARCFAVDGVRYLNREDDAGDRGLRTSKLQYLPCMRDPGDQNRTADALGLYGRRPRGVQRALSRR